MDEILKRLTSIEEELKRINRAIGNTNSDIAGNFGILNQRIYAHIDEIVEKIITAINTQK